MGNALALVSAMAAISNPTPAWPREATTIAQEAHSIAQKRSARGRQTDMERLATRIHDHPEQAQEADIQALTELLTARDDLVRYWAAISLSFIGPRARSALPALRQAFEEKHCARESKNSTSGAAVALRNMGEPPPSAPACPLP
ncbi:hypothetical protein [Nitrospirillum sp. BR 11828]|uniref:hypothetical protein n=1 Tax=Nitrospirillum sp. BR 11828 TaxID=3104325 RepID=UPI002ACAE761|nr:hypothetical protein [Nitrospirillum sp. BR 11828]MDZ5650428.1 hypothetical protein [Nitrospirillum sp. BR 11828]